MMSAASTMSSAGEWESRAGPVVAAASSAASLGPQRGSSHRDCNETGALGATTLQIEKSGGHHAREGTGGASISPIVSNADSNGTMCRFPDFHGALLTLAAALLALTHALPNAFEAIAGDAANGLSGSVAPSLLLGLGFAAVLSSLPAGMLVDRAGPAAGAAVGGLLAAGSAACMSVVRDGWLGALLYAGACLGCGWVVVSALAAAVRARWAPAVGVTSAATSTGLLLVELCFETVRQEEWGRCGASPPGDCWRAQMRAGAVLSGSAAAVCVGLLLVAQQC